MKLDCFVKDGASLDIRPASAEREWMDNTPNKHAYRCLPLSIANSHGWVIHCPKGFTARWRGGPLTTDLDFTYDTPPLDHPPVVSAFGSGIITFHVPALFRTPPGINLWVMGPPNCIRDGVQPLAGVIETDWLTEQGFTMNWKITRPYHDITFEQGDPFCFLFPIPRDLIESVRPALHAFETAPEIKRQFDQGQAQRRAFQQKIGVQQDGEATYVGQDQSHQWQRTYFQGRDATGTAVPGHQTRLQLRPFAPKSS